VACGLAIPAVACTHLTTDSRAPVAIEFSALPNPYVEVGDTLRLHVRVLDRAGDSIPDADVRIAVVDTAYLALDSADRAVIGRAPASAARVVALSGTVRSDTFSVRVPAGHADSLALAGPAVDTVEASDTASVALVAKVLDLTTTPGTAAPLGARYVRFTIVLPVFASHDSATVRLASDSLWQAVQTDAAGLAAVTIRRRGATQPDSAVVQAAATRSSGAALRGSPVRFVVRFR